MPALATLNDAVSEKLESVSRSRSFPGDDRRALRTDLYLVGEGLGKLGKSHGFATAQDQATSLHFKSDADKFTKYIPVWVKVCVALALGLGTMIGWKRIVVTVGEKIGKSHLTYAQGASAELEAMCTIGAADYYGLRSARPTCSRPASPERWPPTIRGSRRRRSGTCCSPGC